LKKAVIVLSGGIDSVCMAAYLKPKYELYGITFSYGQRADQEVKIAKKFSRILNLKQHKIVDISFMRDIYGKTNVLTDSKQKIPQKFEYSIVVPIRNAVFLSIASAWAYTLNSVLVAYGAHTGDRNYPDCRPAFTKKLETAFNQGEIDGIKSKIRNEIKIWSPFIEGLSKDKLLEIGYKKFDKLIFQTWSCYSNKTVHCGQCESCNNRKIAFYKAKITDKTKYLK
jgi:7-cyano-7-deazaguanine synthase